MESKQKKPEPKVTIKPASATISSQDRLNLTSSLATMLTSGIDILEAVESLIGESKGNLLKILKSLKEDLNQGKTVSESFSRFPKAFDPITINLIKAAEETGTLDLTLKDLTETIKKDMDFVSKVKGALAYPILVVIVLIGVVVLNLFFVIPRIATVFTKLRVQIPTPTKILIEISNFVTHNTLYTIAALLAAMIAIYLLFKIKKQLLLNILFSFPLISKLIVEIDLTRFTRSMGVLLKSGIPITDSLELSEKVVIKSAVKSAIAESLRLVNSGKNISDGLSKYPKTVPGFAIRIIEAGERSGSLEKSMTELAEQFDSRVTNRLKSLTTLIEPLLLLFVGLMVGAIMLAIIAPIYKLIGSIGVRGQ